MDDLISRKAAIDSINRTFAKSLAKNRAIDCIKCLPTAHPTKARWERKYEDWRHQMSWLECSNCHSGQLEAYDFCPYCGAEMEDYDEHDEQASE